MTTVAIVPETIGGNGTRYRAMSGLAQSVGNTPGEALDAVSALLDATMTSTLIVVQQLRPDEFFTAEQQQQLAALMLRWRCARDAGGPWSAEEQAELDALVEAELRAAGQRAAPLVGRLAP